MPSKMEQKEVERFVNVSFWIVAGLIGLMVLFGYLKDSGVL